MKRLILSSLSSILLTSLFIFGCASNSSSTSQLELGRQKLFNTDMTIEAIEHLIRATTSKEDESRAQALLAIAYSHLVTQGLGDRYRIEKEIQIAELGIPELELILESIAIDSRIKNSAMQVLIEKGEPAIPILIDFLNNPAKIEIREEIIAILIGINSAKPIAEALNRSELSVEVKRELIEILSRLGSSEVIPDLRFHLQHSVGILKLEIQTALYRLGVVKLRSAILAHSNDKNVEARRIVARTLSHMNHFPLDEVLETLMDTDTQVQIYAIEATAKHPTEEAIEPLFYLLVGSASEEVKQVATESLIVHAERGFGIGIARQIVDSLYTVDDSKNRLRLASLLRNDFVKKQIVANPMENLEYKLWNYTTNSENSELVRGVLSRLLEQL